jgi:UDP-N-acetylglucosamine 2-epimerase (hydrolysing)
MKNAQAILGNSSAGVREAPFLGVPSLDVGTRQSNRSSARSITHVNAFDRAGIATFLDQEWGRRYPSDHSFGNGCAADAFAETLGNPHFWDIPMQKRFCD